MTKPVVPPAAFEPEFIALLKHIFDERITFNRHIGLRLDEVLPLRTRARIAMKPELVGNFTHQRMHGGVTSACLDAVGGIAAMASVCARHMDDAPLRRVERFAKLGTIDLRVDFLRPVVGEHFSITAEVLRSGSRVATTRMEFLGPDGTLLSAGMAAYIVS